MNDTITTKGEASMWQFLTSRLVRIILIYSTNFSALMENKKNRRVNFTLARVFSSERAKKFAILEDVSQQQKVDFYVVTWKKNYGRRGWGAQRMMPSCDVGISPVRRKLRGFIQPQEFLYSFSPLRNINFILLHIPITSTARNRQRRAKGEENSEHFSN